ncbi:MAG: hypothetical protein EOO65_04830, partial [Methanosarcinales archaeon]
MAASREPAVSSTAAPATAPSSAAKPPVTDAVAAVGRAGGVYIPPHRLAAMRAAAAAAGGDGSSAEEQRLAWEGLRKALNGSINKVNTTNIVNIIPEVFSANLVRGRGLFCRAIMKAQMASPTFTHVYAALVAVVNTKLPEVGELLLKRIVIQFRRAFKRNNKVVAVALAKFIAHLVNQLVAHELLALEVLMLLLDTPSDDSVEVAVGFMKECGAYLSNVAPAGVNAVFDRFRSILQDGDIDMRVQYLLEGLFAVRKAKFAEHVPILPELDLVEAEDQITHELSLADETLDAEEMLDVWQFDANFVQNEAEWKEIRRDILGEEEEAGEAGEAETGAPGEDAEVVGGSDAEGMDDALV